MYKSLATNLTNSNLHGLNIVAKAQLHGLVYSICIKYDKRPVYIIKLGSYTTLDYFSHQTDPISFNLNKPALQ